ncbi:SPFH domain-containing protein [Paenibacillus montanisoli]|uniref:SPFH domain-containing protein n=1 Tax=Paenibacillus montanisoli TaxID=2081970 RepID=A0A328U0T9_9BACL|nr:SPFH domain-containing protein [Paenibacillus montanisoli]RAP75662.1 SPFH domain-containing protein [Paenibacillus montanisoli]
MIERKAWYVNGFIALLLFAVIAAGAVICLVYGVGANPSGLLISCSAVLMLLLLIGLSSLVIIHPNQSKVITFFGKYVGTVLESGFWMVMPFAAQRTVSLKVRNFNSQQLKVNDAEGNPVEIAAVVVFKVVDTAKATFDVDQYEKFVEIQSETAVRHIAAQYPYDNFADHGSFTLRGNADEVAHELMSDLQNRLSIAGVQILETRLTHLAYAQEIASAMLQRQQASAIVAARHLIVEGAVGMVEMALRRLEENGIALDSERRAAMTNNLMVAIVSDKGATPVINTGTLYT